MSSGYVEHGPWNNGAPPGLDSSFFDDVENWIINTDNTPPHQISGLTSGTATLYQIFAGTLYKKVMIVLNNFRNGSVGTAQTIVVPTPFTQICSITTRDFAAFGLLSGSLINEFVLQTLNTSGGTPGSAQTSMAQYSFAQCGAWDTISFNFGQTSAHTGIAFFEGI